MHEVLLVIHSLIRWLILVAGTVIIIRALQGSHKSSWSAYDQRWLAIYVHSISLQFVIGLILYIFVSPITTQAFADFGAAMKDRVIRFWAVEHTSGMVIALVLAHIGSARIRKAPDEAKHKRALLFIGLSLVVILVSIPWPFLSFGRPLFRFWGIE